MCNLCGQQGNSSRKENFTFSVHTAQSRRRDRLWNLSARGFTCRIQIRYLSCLWTGTAMSPQLDITAAEDEESCDKVSLEPHLQLQSNCTTCSKTESPLSPHSASTSEEEFRVSQIPRHNRHQNCSGHCPLVFRRVQYTHLQWAPGQRMTVKHKTHQWWLYFT